MNTTIYYFSGTGNSLHIAKRLAEELGEYTLVSMAKSVRETTTIVPETEQIGFVFPVYFWGLPGIVHSFVEKLQLERVTYIFAASSCGGGPGYTMPHLEQLMNAKSKSLNAGWVLRMPGNYIIPAYYKYANGYLQPEKQQARLENADREIQRIAQTIRERQSLKPKNNPLLNAVTKHVNTLFYSLYLGDLGAWDKKYHITDQCNGCETCAKVCPVQNISVSDGKPQWQHRCEQCMGCIQLCPQHAIQFADKTAHKPRYRHPNVSLKELMSQSA